MSFYACEAKSISPNWEISNSQLDFKFNANNLVKNSNMEKWQKKFYQSSLVLKAIFNSYFCFEMWLSLCLLLVCLKRIFYFSYLFLNLKFIWILLTCPSTKIWNSPVIQDKMSLGSTIYQQKPVNCKVVQAFIFFFLCQLFALLIDLL